MGASAGSVDDDDAAMARLQEVTAKLQALTDTPARIPLDALADQGMDSRLEELVYSVEQV